MYIDDWGYQINTPVVGEENSNWNIQDLCEVLQDAVEDSGRRCEKENRKKVFLALSGGLNSSLILALLDKAIANRRTIIINETLGHPSTNPDVYHSGLVALNYKRTFHTARGFISHEIFEKKIKNAVRVLFEEKEIFGEIRENILIEEYLATFLIFERLGEHNEKPTSVLVGFGADELFGGPFHRALLSEYRNNGLQKIFEDLWDDFATHRLPMIRTIASYFGITPLFPFLNKRVVEFVSQIPLTDRTRGDFDREILRSIARGILPPKIANREKNPITRIAQ